MEHNVFFGNGLNLLSDNPFSWEKLLETIKGINTFINGKLPNTMIYERAVLEDKSIQDVRKKEQKVKEEIARYFKEIETNDFYKRLFNLKCPNYLTTNYDYAFQKSILEMGNFDITNNSTEDLYSIRRSKSIFNKKNKEQCKIWNIHGEIDIPISIMLGLDHYCGSIGKLDAFVKGKYEYIERKETIKVESIISKLKDNTFNGKFWAELFFNSNIHVLGFSFDYSETDLWWLLTRRAKELNKMSSSSLIKNKIYFYDPNISTEKLGLLESLNVEVISTTNIQFRDDWDKMDWRNYYNDTITLIEKTLST
jgi:SIR2-like domain